jgi:hypothetical protein
MFAAFFGASQAHRGAELAQGLGEGAAARHIAGRQAADGGAIHVERDAAHQMGHVGFLQARRGALIASGCAGMAGLDAGKAGGVGHGFTPGFGSARTAPLRRYGKPHSWGVDVPLMNIGAPIAAFV